MKNINNPLVVTPSNLLLSLENLRVINLSRPLTLNEFFTSLGEQGHGLLLIILSLIFATGLPLTGITTVLGVLMSIIFFRWMLGLNPWIPRSYAFKELPQSIMTKILSWSIILIGAMEPFLKERHTFWVDHYSMRLIFGIVMILTCFYCAMPLPIGFNIPGGVILLFGSLVVTKRDGYMVYPALAVFCGLIVGLLLLSGFVIRSFS